MRGTRHDQPSSLDLQFQRMYEESLSVVYGFLLVRVGGHVGLAEDLTAETFTAAMREYRVGRPEAVTSSWLLTVARRRLIDHWRHQTFACEIGHMVTTPATVRFPNVGEQDLVARSLAALSEPQRVALILQYLEGYPVAEIAEIIGRSPKATESLLVRSRSAFREAYTEVNA